LKYAEDKQASRIVNIYLQVGELRDFEEEWMQRYFDYLSENTIAEGGKIIIKKISAAFECKQCTNIFSADIRQDNIICPGCSYAKNELVRGNEFLIESIEVI